jgi:hypothetical protein
MKNTALARGSSVCKLRMRFFGHWALGEKNFHHAKFNRYLPAGSPRKFQGDDRELCLLASGSKNEEIHDSNGLCPIE